tara:strand:+ start:266 stop:769 length:504 start_codon:yes stop_codon:yes gene_type:complete
MAMSNSMAKHSDPTNPMPFMERLISTYDGELKEPAVVENINTFLSDIAAAPDEDLTPPSSPQPLATPEREFTPRTRRSPLPFEEGDDTVNLISPVERNLAPSDAESSSPDSLPSRTRRFVNALRSPSGALTYLPARRAQIQPTNRLTRSGHLRLTRDEHLQPSTERL